MILVQPAGKGLELLSASHGVALKWKTRHLSLFFVLIAENKQGYHLHPWHLYSWQSGWRQTMCLLPAMSKAQTTGNQDSRSWDLVVEMRTTIYSSTRNPWSQDRWEGGRGQIYVHVYVGHGLSVASDIQILVG